MAGLIKRLINILLKFRFYLIVELTFFAIFWLLYIKLQDHGCTEETCEKSVNQFYNNGDKVFISFLKGHFLQKDDEWRLLDHKSVRLRSFHNCSHLKNLRDLTFVRNGYTKTVYKSALNNAEAALKVVNVDGHDVKACVNKKKGDQRSCYLFAASKLLREINILSNFTHPNIAKMYGYCIPHHPNFMKPQMTVSILEEYGEPISVIQLLQMSWEDRLRISLGLSRLLQYLSSSKEPVSLNDLRRQQFILVDGEPKLVDVDDIGLQEQQCHSPCCTAATNGTVCIPCKGNVCHGFNDRLNIIKTGKHFIEHILPHGGVPNELKPLVDRIIKAFECAVDNSSFISGMVEELAEGFKSGSYRRSKEKFLHHFFTRNQSDITSAYDYRCLLSMHGAGCSTSVHDAEEAAEFCWSDSTCKAFVMTTTKTWTGRSMVHFKKGTGFVPNTLTSVFVKI